jgi:hypothetical protein
LNSKLHAMILGRLDEKNIVIIGKCDILNNNYINDIELKYKIANFYIINGEYIKNKVSFIKEVCKVTPLVSNPGDNLNAFRDNLLTLGMFNYIREKHMIIWSSAHILYHNDPIGFSEVVDWLLGTIKELTVGDEKDRILYPDEFSDWTATWIRCLIQSDTHINTNGNDFSTLQNAFWDLIFINRDSNTEVIHLSLPTEQSGGF